MYTRPRFWMSRTPNSRLRTFVPLALQPLARSIYHALFRVSLRFRCWLADLAEMGDPRELAPPAMLRYGVCETLSRAEFFRIGAGCANLIRAQLAKTGVDLAAATRVLDFGCGCGRTLQWLLRAYPKVEFHGVDVDREAIAWCRKSFREQFP